MTTTSDDAWYRSVLERSPTAVVALDADGAIVRHSPAFQRVFGDASIDPTTEPLVDAIHPSDRDEFERFIGDASRASDAPTDGTDFRTDVEGTDERWVEAVGRSAADLPDASAIVYARDVTDRKARERTLEHYEQIVETVSDAAFVLDDEGRFEMVNRQMVERTGYSKADLIGNRTTVLISQADHDTGEAALRDVILDDDEEFARYENVIHTADGESYPVEVLLSPLFEDGEYVGSAGISRRITERKRRERKLERQKERLDRFASAVSHDLRNPLNVVESSIELARHEADIDELDRAEDAIGRMEDIIDDVLTLARQGEVVSETEQVALDAVAEAAWANVETGDATLQCQDSGTVDADRNRLLQVFENLFRNAIEHAGPSVHVTVDRLDTGGFVVEDDGPGVPESEREKVFEHAYTTNEEGTGFGLRIVRDIVEAHGWDVRLVDGRSGGARFEILTVPAGEPDGPS